MRDNHFSFERMIHPVGADTFLREYWEQKPLLIARGKPDYYCDVLSMADIDSIVGFRQLEYSQLKIARAEQAQPAKVFYVDSDSTSRPSSYASSTVAGPRSTRRWPVLLVTSTA